MGDTLTSEKNHLGGHVRYFFIVIFKCIKELLLPNIWQIGRWLVGENRNPGVTLYRMSLDISV